MNGSTGLSPEEAKRAEQEATLIASKAEFTTMINQAFAREEAKRAEKEAKKEANRVTSQAKKEAKKEAKRAQQGFSELLGKALRPPKKAKLNTTHLDLETDTDTAIARRDARSLLEATGFSIKAYAELTSTLSWGKLSKSNFDTDNNTPEHRGIIARARGLGRSKYLPSLELTPNSTMIDSFDGPGPVEWDELLGFVKEIVMKYVMAQSTSTGHDLTGGQLLKAIATGSWGGPSDSQQLLPLLHEVLRRSHIIRSIDGSLERAQREIVLMHEVRHQFQSY